MNWWNSKPEGGHYFVTNWCDLLLTEDEAAKANAIFKADNRSSTARMEKAVLRDFFNLLGRDEFYYYNRSD